MYWKKNLIFDIYAIVHSANFLTFHTCNSDTITFDYHENLGDKQDNKLLAVVYVIQIRSN